MFFSSGYFLWVMLPSLAITLFAQWRVKSAMSRWSRVQNARGITGAKTAELVMRHAGLTHVAVARVPGQLTDYYDPRDRSIHLSDSSTGAPTVAAMAIVAHELGHAQQDMTGSGLLHLRARLVPAANIGTQLGLWLVLIGYFVGLTQIAWLGVALFAGFVAFTLVTLPVEFDASRRAKGFLKELGIVSPEEQKGVNAVLDAAALTYVAAAATAVLQLLYYVSLLTGRRRN
ncbi:MAG: zinc metallopeptidase [Anaerolineae bacterium]